LTFRGVRPLVNDFLFTAALYCVVDRRAAGIGGCDDAMSKCFETDGNQQCTCQCRGEYNQCLFSQLQCLPWAAHKAWWTVSSKAVRTRGVLLLRSVHTGWKYGLWVPDSPQ
jgi:hypothetical protein